MTLKEHIDDIRDKLEKGEVPPNEAAVCDDIVRRLVHELGWPRYQSQIVYPQYPVEGGKVDFALCHPPSEPCVFIEVKQVGNIEGAEEQLFRYAFRRGVPIAILTDGQKWRFFYPIGQGDYRERKVHEMDLTENDSEKSAERLNRYLNYESIRTGEAAKAIEEDYRNVSRQRQVATRLPEAWNKLVEEANEFLVHAVAEKTESLCGHRPTDKQVLTFLKNLKKETELDRSVAHTQPISPVSRVQPAPHHGSEKQKAPPKRLVVTMPNGEVIQHHNAMATFRETIFKLGPEEVLRVDTERILISTEPIPKRRTSPYGGYHFTENHGTPAKKDLLDRIASRLGVQLQVEIVDK